MSSSNTSHCCNTPRQTPHTSCQSTETLLMLMWTGVFSAWFSFSLMGRISHQAWTRSSALTVMTHIVPFIFNWLHFPKKTEPLTYRKHTRHPCDHTRRSSSYFNTPSLQRELNHKQPHVDFVQRLYAKQPNWKQKSSGLSSNSSSLPSPTAACVSVNLYGR